MSDNKMPDEIWINKTAYDKLRIDEGDESYVGDEIKSREYIAKDLVNLKAESVPVSELEGLIEETKNLIKNECEQGKLDVLGSAGALYVIERFEKDLQNLIDGAT